MKVNSPRLPPGEKTQPKTGKCPITILPTRKKRENFPFSVPCAGCKFDVLDEIGERNCGMQPDQYVQMVLHAVDAVQMTVFVFGDSPNVFEQFFPASCIKDT